MAKNATLHCHANIEQPFGTGALRSTTPAPPEVKQSERNVAVERWAWWVCAAATAVAGSLLWRFGISIDRPSLAAALGALMFLIATHILYGRWRPAPALRNLSGAVAVIYWSAATAGIISLIGLRFQFPTIDHALAASDRLAGFDGAWIVQRSADYRFLSRLFGIAYDSSFPLLFALAVFLAVWSHNERLWRLALVFAMTIVFCTTISILLPAKGAFAYFGFSADVLDRLPAGAGVYHLAKFEYFRDNPSPLLSFASLQGVVTFPSFHCCLALMTIAATWSMRWLFPMSLAWNALVIASTVPIGGHYAIDILSGAAAWLGANAVAMRLARPRFEPMDQDRTGPALHESAIGST